LTTGLLLHTLLVVLGLSFLIRENEFIFFVLKLIGALYFIYLAIVVYGKRKNITDNDVYESENNNYFKKGLIMNLVNPKVSLFFIALFPNFIFHDTLNSEIQFFILGLIFWFQANFIFIGFSLFSSKIKDFLSTNNSLTNKRYLIEISVYVFFSIWILK
jgi:threonine/homoserine/homoserine lactone efflux protein